MRENFRYFSVLEGTSIANDDTAGDPEFFGYTRPGGSWVILKHDKTLNTYGLHLGRDLDLTLALYDIAWANKATLTYKRAGNYPSL